MLEKIAIIWLIFINVHGVILINRDRKYASSDSVFRIPTRTFVYVALLGGGIGVLLAMLILRHRTTPRALPIAVTVIALLEIALGIYLKLR